MKRKGTLTQAIVSTVLLYHCALLFCWTSKPYFVFICYWILAQQQSPLFSIVIQYQYDLTTRFTDSIYSLTIFQIHFCGQVLCLNTYRNQRLHNQTIFLFFCFSVVYIIYFLHVLEYIKPPLFKRHVLLQKELCIISKLFIYLKINSRIAHFI